MEWHSELRPFIAEEVKEEKPSSAADREVLLVLYRSTGGANWEKKWGWNTNAHLSKWCGVTVNDQGRVVKLNLQWNNLQGHIPPQLGDLGALAHLNLNGNKLDGPIPKELGALRELRALKLSINQLSGHIPPQLGDLGALLILSLASNKLDGEIPALLGQLRNMRQLLLHNNNLTGPLPKELGALSNLEHLMLYGNNLADNELDGGPMAGESLRSWRARLREQQPAEPDVGKEEVTVQRSSPAEGGEPAKSDVAPVGGTSSPEEKDAERSLRVQVASFGELENLTRENAGALEGLRQLIGKPTGGGFSLGTEFDNEDKLRELDRLVAMAKDLDEMTLQHMEDKNIQRKELALPPGSKAYYITVRTGLGNAYLAASVVASRLVSTSKTGGMGKAGEALKVLSSAVPVVGGLASFTAAALKAGDRHVQTRRVVKITEMAIDANECCSLARTLALRLVDGLAAGTIPKICKVEEYLLPAMAGVGGGAGGYGWNQGIGALSDGASEEAVLEWFTDEVANAEFNINARGTAAEQAGRQLGKRHLQKLLLELGRGCLQGASTADEKVERLLKVIAPEASGKPVTTRSAPEKSFVESPIPAPSHGGGLDQGAELVALKAQMEALLAADKRRQAAEERQKEKVEALELAEERRQAEIAALQSDNKKLQSENSLRIRGFWMR